MNPNAVALKQGWLWFVEGWRLFRMNPVIWIVGAAIWLGIEIALAFIPVIGPAIDALILPMLFAGFLHGARDLDNGEPLTVPTFFRGASDHSKLLPLLTLGVLSAGYEIVSAGFALLVGPIQAVVIIGPLGVMVVVALIYAVPLVIFEGLDAVSAVKRSFEACGENVAPLLIVFVILLGFAMITVMTLGAALLVIMPVTFCAAYRSYKSVYGQKVEPQPSEAAGGS